MAMMAWQVCDYKAQKDPEKESMPLLLLVCSVVVYILHGSFGEVVNYFFSLSKSVQNTSSVALACSGFADLWTVRKPNLPSNYDIYLRVGDSISLIVILS